MPELSSIVNCPLPPYRKLRVFAFDPALSRRIETYEMNEVTIRIPWEPDLSIGPVDGYLEIVDRDPASRSFYPPVDLMDSNLLAQDGLPPAEGNPQFHQQMVYAVARNTISHFEAALGRKVLWSPRVIRDKEKISEEYVDRLRIYPHGLREANAYYDPEIKALLFGYFPAPPGREGDNLPGETIFSCLSHDIVAHETTHAIIDGLHPKFIEPSNWDVSALHEALADIISLFQHFTYPDVLKSQIARTGGDLEKQNMLGELAWQFGQAIGSYGALRSALGSYDPVTKVWLPHKPDPRLLLRTTECHDRGAIFVAAIFDAFITIYKTRIRDLIRIATGGTGALPAGELSPDLVNRLADEAAKSARHMLGMCIRALDYCPPVDPDAGDFLRAMITADRDLVTDDPYNYRLAVIDAFRQWGIFPQTVRSLSVESLIWHVPNSDEQKKFSAVFGDAEIMKSLVPEWDRKASREKVYRQARTCRILLHKILMKPECRDAGEAARLVMQKPLPSVFTKDGHPTLEVHSVRPARRIGPDGQTELELVIEITQRRRGYCDPAIQDKVDNRKIPPPEPDFIFRGGCTLLVDPDSGRVRYCIYKNVMDNERLARMRNTVNNGVPGSLYSTYFGNPYLTYYRRHLHPESGEGAGPGLFAMLHNRNMFPEGS
jgi:hypothetical protein